MTANPFALASGKDLILSRSFWGVAIFVFGRILQLAGFEFGDEATALDQVMAAVAILSQAIGPILSVWGTIQRKGPITSIAGIGKDF